MENRTMTMTTSEIEREALEILNIIDAIRRMLIDLPVERKRLVVEEIDKWISLEEASHAKAVGQEH